MLLGVLYGIGVGPSDPELIALKGLRLLPQVPVVAFPAGVNSKPWIAELWLDEHQLQLALTLVMKVSSVYEQVWAVLQQRSWLQPAYVVYGNL